MNRTIIHEKFHKKNDAIASKLFDLSRVVLCFISTPYELDDGGDLVAGPFEQADLTSEWFHIGCSDRIPRAFVGQALTLESDVPISLGGDLGELRLRGQWIFLNAWKLSRKFDKSRVWYIRFFSSYLHPAGHWARFFRVVVL